MAIDEHALTFAGLPVRDYDAGGGIDDPEHAAYRLTVDYDAAEAGDTMAALIAQFCLDPAASRVRALVIGAWEHVWDPTASTREIVAALASAAETLTALRALFVGDVTAEESEISWIQQSDMTPLFAAYPRLEHFRVRGGSGLAIAPLRHDHLRSLTVETGGLDGAVVRGIAASHLPALEHLELWIGEEGYGRTTRLDDLGPILGGGAFPALRYLGLRDCEEANEVAAALAVAPVLSRIKVLDLSLGDLDDEGAMALVASPALATLEKLDIHHHYVSPETIAVLESVGIAVDASDPQEPDRYGDEDHRYIAVSE